MALATVVHVEASSYRRPGARMLIMEDGSWIGGISGGCLEGDVLRKAKQTMMDKKARIFRYDTRTGDPYQIGVGLGCNGLIDILIQAIGPTSQTDPIELLRMAGLNRAPSVLLTVLESPQEKIQAGSVISMSDIERYFTPLMSNASVEALLKHCKDIKEVKRSIILESHDNESSWKFFAEYLIPNLQIFVFGSNYDVLPLIKISNELGWNTVLVSKISKLSRELFHLPDKVLEPESVTKYIDEYSAALIMAHDYATDLANLRLAVNSKASYIGLLGPRDRSEKLFADLRKEGCLIDEENIFAPVGLDTGATTPEEIAISILAEIRTHLSGRQGSFLRNRKKPIND